MFYYAAFIVFVNCCVSKWILNLLDIEKSVYKYTHAHICCLFGVCLCFMSVCVCTCARKRACVCVWERVYVYVHYMWEIWICAERTKSTETKPSIQIESWHSSWRKTMNKMFPEWQIYIVGQTVHKAKMTKTSHMWQARQRQSNKRRTVFFLSVSYLPVYTYLSFVFLYSSHPFNWQAPNVKIIFFFLSFFVLFNIWTSLNLLFKHVTFFSSGFHNLFHKTHKKDLPGKRPLPLKTSLTLPCLPCHEKFQYCISSLLWANIKVSLVSKYSVFYVFSFILKAFIAVTWSKDWV